MDYAAHLRDTARHLIAMVDQPAFRAHAALRLEQLVASDPLYERLPEVIRELRAEAAKA